MISGEQINAIDKAIVFLIHDNPYCRLNVQLDEITVETADGEDRVYDVHAQAYKTELCEVCWALYLKEEMASNAICQDCTDEGLDNQ